MKRTIWIGPDNEQYETEDEAWEQACAEFDMEDFFAYLQANVSYEQFFNRARTASDFWDEFETDFDYAESEYFMNNYTEKEVEEEDE